jgi:hypothetical protein
VNNTRIAVASTIAVLFAMPAGAQAQSGYTTPVDTTVSIEHGGTLSVSVYAGRVNVTGGSGSQVQIRGSTERTDLEIRARPTSVTIGTDPEGPHRGRVELDIVVPIGTRVVLDGFSAPFSVKGVKGEVKVQSLNGSAVVNDAVGRVYVETVAGNIDIDRVDGDVTAEAVSGQVGITNVKGDIDTESVSGRIQMTGAQSNTVRAESVSGSLTYDGTFDETGSYSFKTHSGRVTLGMPANAGATVSLESFSGTVDSDFPVTMLSSRNRGEEGDNRFEFKVGNGKARVVAETFSGGIRIMRGTTSQSRDQ